MASVIQSNFRARRSYATSKTIIKVPNLIDVQRRSYKDFLQADVEPSERTDTGLQGVYKSVFPFVDYNGTSELSFVNYTLEEPKYDVEECHAKGMTYEAPVKVDVRLIVYDKDETGEKTIHDVQEQQVYFGAIPLMTEEGTFIINGTERVIVSQMHRSPGAFFDNDGGKASSKGKLVFSARIIPYSGSWVDFEFDSKDILHVRIDRKRKMPATILLRALGYSTEELLKIYYKTETLFLTNEGCFRAFDRELLFNQKACKDIYDPNTGEVLVKEKKKFTKVNLKKMAAAGITKVPVTEEFITTRVAAEDYFDEETGEFIVECNQELTAEIIEKIREAGINEIQILYFDDDGVKVGRQMHNTLAIDKCQSPEQARIEIYTRSRPGDPPTTEEADKLLNSMFFNPSKYDLSKVGRLKLNHKFGLDTPPDHTTLTKEDIIETVRYLLDLAQGTGDVVADDIDHLGNRRVRAVGELLENTYKAGLIRMERGIKERMSISQTTDVVRPHDLINSKPVNAVIREYFGSSQLSQFMDQTNPLSELTHKRRLSALGPGGLDRERAGFKVRDVHPTHYGRICPIETPEGPNIGLINSLSTYARVNEYGFIETPYRRVKGRQITDEVEFLSALEEEGHRISPANVEIDANNCLVGDMIECHENGELVVVNMEEERDDGEENISYIDVSPNQLVSVAAGLVPFLENDDANRALMGANMQRQAVPLLVSEAAFVGTGMEALVAKDSRVAIVAKRSGTVESVDATRVVIIPDRDDNDLSVKPDIYNLYKYRRSNQGTCFNQIPVVNIGEHVEAGDVIVDGPSTDCGELALGKNVLVAFLPWGGYNYEDSILLSERMLKDDVFTSIHIEDFECIARDTKLGKEEITRDIPNVSEEALKDLDDTGIIRIGAEIKPGDILVGKVTPKGETQLSPEEKLLRAIFGEKAGDVRDSSMRVPPGVVGTIIDAKVFSRKREDHDDRSREIEAYEEERLTKNMGMQIKIIRNSGRARIREMLIGQVSTNKVSDENGSLKKGDTITAEILDSLTYTSWQQIQVKEQSVNEKVRALFQSIEKECQETREYFEDKITKLQKGDELPPGVLKIVKISVAIKRKIQIGDKMAGRHGNKGVVSQILPVEDMPFLEDGTPVDMVLNPLGVPSRMNVGQILEIHLGWAARGMGKKIDAMIENARKDHCEKLRQELIKAYPMEDTVQLLQELDEDNLIKFAEKCRFGIHVATPVFDGAQESDINALMNDAGLEGQIQSTLFDGRTGEPFASDVTVGIMYMLKLHHLVDEKIHARSIGPYSLVTQQPLGGKTQFGGQRLGEMEVWAMMAYGAAYSLQEFLTVKSDDVNGRTRMYESIVKGDFALEAGLPESFNVLVKEMQSLCLNIEKIKEDGPQAG